MSKYRLVAIDILEHLAAYTTLDGENWHTVEDEMTDIIEAYYGEKVFYIPTEWTVCANIEVKAKSLEDAVRILDETIDEVSLPTDPNYVDGTHKRWKSEDDEEDNLEYYKTFN